MPVSEVQIYLAKLTSFKSILDKWNQKAKQERVSLPLADNFNDLISEIGQKFPDIAAHLPKQIERMTGTPMMRIGMPTTSTHLDLEIYVEQTINILKSVEAGKHG